MWTDTMISWTDATKAVFFASSAEEFTGYPQLTGASLAGSTRGCFGVDQGPSAAKR